VDKLETIQQLWELVSSLSHLQLLIFAYIVQILSCTANPAKEARKDHEIVDAGKVKLIFSVEKGYGFRIDLLRDAE
jgi:hypothetical protein